MAHDHPHPASDHSHPATVPEGSLSDLPPGTSRIVLAVQGMDCADEVKLLNEVLKPLPGVRGVQANLMAAQVTVAHEGQVTPEQLIAAIRPTGLEARLATQKTSPAQSTQAQRRRTLSVIISGVCTAAGLTLQWLHLFPTTQIAIFGAAIIASGWFIFPKGLAALRRLALDMNVLMTIAVAGAAIIGEWSEGAAVTFLFGLSELLEAYSVQRARRAVESLLSLSPDTASVKRGGTFAEVPVEEVEVDETVAVRSGTRIPLDGVVLTGTSAVNQAPITGESLPVEKKAEDTVFAGTVNGEGALEIRVTKASGDTMLARIIQLVSQAQAQKAPSERFVDTFAKYYTPGVMLLAILVFLTPPLVLGGEWHTWAYRALVLLVIACPCALVISTPVSVVSGLTAMARRGVLIKGGAHLEAVGKLRALAVDKTGTVTEGKPRVQRVVLLQAQSEAEVLSAAAALDTHSNHPLAQAVVAYATDQKVAFPRSTNYQSRTGRGADGEIEGVLHFVGNHRFAHELGVCTPESEAALAEIKQQGLSVVIVGRKSSDRTAGGILGILTIGDSIRRNAAPAIAQLHAAGVERVVMLSGDNQRTADVVAKQAGIDEAQGDLLPDDKIARIRELTARYGQVGMVGDGVNDAPAMAAATVGIAMGGAGTDTAIETADMALMQDDLEQLAAAILLGRRTVKIIQFNIAFALALKAIFLILALAGYTSLWLAIAADTGATLLVVANALRLLGAVPAGSTPAPEPRNCASQCSCNTPE